jgi:ketosteroid isomerase-like protein
MRKIFFFLFVLLSTGFLITSCSDNNSEATGKTGKDSTATLDMVAIRKIIDEKNNEFAKAFVSGDSASMLSNYTTDAKLFPPNSDAVAGKEAIAAVISEYLKYGIKEFKDETTALYGAGDNVVEEGNLFMGDGKDKTIDKGKYICIWRKVNGEWKVSSDMWNTSLPATTAK